MRIRSKVALVGGIPIVIAAAIAVIAWLLLNEAERTREGAVLAGAVYRDLLGSMTERNTYVSAQASERGAHAARFTAKTGEGLAHLDALADIARDPTHRAMIADTRQTLSRYRDRMRELVAVTESNDRLIAEMGQRASSLIALSDEARERQRRSNADIVASLTAGDRKLRLARDIVDRAHELRAAIAAVWLQEARAESAAARETGAPAQSLSFALARLRNTAGDLLQVLQ